MIKEIEENPKEWIESVGIWYDEMNEMCTDCGTMRSDGTRNDSPIGMCDELENRCRHIHQNKEWMIVFRQKEEDIQKRVTEIVSRIQMMDANRSILFQNRMKSMDASWNEKDLIIRDMIESVMNQLNVISQGFPWNDQIAFDSQIEQIVFVETILKLFLEFVTLIEMYSLFRKEYETVAKHVMHTIKQSNHLERQLQSVKNILHNQISDLSDMPRRNENGI